MGKVKSKLISFALFGCFGITVEIFFTAISDFVIAAGEGVYNFRLMGQSYIWMFFIYGLIALLLPPIYSRLAKLPLLVRLLVYTLGIFTIEFITGFLLEQLTGRCPWKYQTGLHIMGYIRLDYAPAWMVFAWGMETYYLFLKKLGVTG